MNGWKRNLQAIVNLFFRDNFKNIFFWLFWNNIIWSYYTTKTQKGYLNITETLCLLFSIFNNVSSRIRWGALPYVCSVKADKSVGAVSDNHKVPYTNLNDGVMTVKTTDKMVENGVRSFQVLMSWKDRRFCLAGFMFLRFIFL